MRSALGARQRSLFTNYWRQLLILWLGVLSIQSAAFADVTDSVAGRRIFASYVVFFARYIEWPKEAFPSRDTPYQVCILGVDPLGSVLDTKLSSKEVNDRRFRIRRIKSGNLEAIPDCHILIVGGSEAATIKEIFGAIDNLSVLTISDIDGFAASGGMIGFVGTGRAMSMQLNRTMLDRGRLKVGDRLLRLGGR